jgi:peptide/nickel transport system substrate-binding protein
MHYTLPMDTRLPPYKDNNVRLALKYAIDREEVVKKILLGHGRPANDHPIGPANLCFAADLPQHTYDPERARYHLKEAGLNSLDVELSVSDAAFEGAVDLGTLYSAQAAKCGINIKVNKTPRDAYWDNVWMKAPWCASYYNGGTVEDYIFSLVYASDASWNESHWKSERFDTLLKQARGELNDSRRCDMYREMQKIVRDEGGSVIPVYGNYVDAANSRVKLDKLAANFEMDGLRAPERWWFE